MNTYQIDTLVSARGVIKLPDMPYLHNQKVKLIIISPEDVTRETRDANRRKQAMQRLLKSQSTQQASRWTDEELDNLRYEPLKEKHL